MFSDCGRTIKGLEDIYCGNFVVMLQHHWYYRYKYSQLRDIGGTEKLFSDQTMRKFLRNAKGKLRLLDFLDMQWWKLSGCMNQNVKSWNMTKHATIINPRDILCNENVWTCRIDQNELTILERIFWAHLIQGVSKAVGSNLLSGWMFPQVKTKGLSLQNCGYYLNTLYIESHRLINILNHLRQLQNNLYLEIIINQG